MFDIGASLTAAREAQGLRLADAERLTCLRGKYLEALETDDFEALPGRAYARAFLRTYAVALGLDGDEFVAEYDEWLPEPPDEQLDIVLPHVARPVPLRLLAAAVAIAGVAGALTWSAFSSGQTHLQPPPAAKAAAPKPKHHVLAAQHSVAPAKPQPLSIRAVDGPCWVLVRKGGATGPVLYEGTIQPGQAVHFAPRVWVRLGAPWNVTVHRGPHAFPAPSHTEPQDLIA